MFMRFIAPARPARAMTARAIEDRSAPPMKRLIPARFLSAALLATLVTCALQAAAQEDVIEPPIIIDSESNDYDLRTGVTRFSDDVTITRGPMRVTADFGEVRQTEDEISEIVLTGSPTRWEDRLDDGSRVQGQAARIHFDVATNIITLTGDARLLHEQGEFTGDELDYNLDTERLAGRGSAGQRARVVLEGDTMRSAGDDEEAPEPGDSSAPETDAGESTAAPAENDQDAEPVEPPASH